jgi:hypothetical protein
MDTEVARRQRAVCESVAEQLYIDVRLYVITWYPGFPILVIFGRACGKIFQGRNFAVLIVIELESEHYMVISKALRNTLDGANVNLWLETDQSWTVKDNFTNNKEQKPEMESLTLIKAYLMVFPG